MAKVNRYEAVAFSVIVVAAVMAMIGVGVSVRWFVMWVWG